MKILIPGPPIALNRPRFSTINKRVYNSQKAEMNATSFIIKSQYHGPQLTGPLSISIIFFMPIPKSLSKKKQQQLAGTYHYKRPDIDNLEKYLLDCIAFSGSVFIDDSQIAMIKSCKIYSFNSRTEFTIRSLRRKHFSDEKFVEEDSETYSL